MENRNINWVAVRAECSAMQMFEKLKLEIESDVLIRNDLRPEDRYYGFKFVPSSGSFTVLRQGNRISSAVAFFLDGGQIVVKKDDILIFAATVTLNDDGECIFKVKGEERSSWQVRKMALEDLFFVGF